VTLDALRQLVHDRSGTPACRAAMGSMFGPQRRMVESQAQRLAVCCSRRSGKSQGIARWLYQGGLSDPGGLSVYVGRTKGLARMVCFSAYEEMRSRWGLEFASREVDGQLMVELPNRHTIWLAGCKNAAEAGKFRGPKYRRFAWDEAQLAGTWLESVIEEDIDPALLDKRGELLLSGTPAPVPEGYFYEASTALLGWERHHWTCRENPHLIDVEGYLRAKLRRLGWTEDHPSFQREWLGLWVLDHDALVFRWDAGRNRGSPPSGYKLRTCIGVDLGGTGTCAWSVLQNPVGLPEVYCVHVESHDAQGPSAVVARTEAILRNYPGAAVVVDAGGLGGAYVLEMRERYGLPAEPAEKSQRRAAIEVLRGDLASGTFCANPHQVGALLDEWSVLQWDEKRQNFDDRFPDHLSDATMYAHRKLRPAYRAKPEEDELDPLTARLERYRTKVRLAALKRAKPGRRI